MKADMILLALSDPSFAPFNSAARQIVFSETGRALATVIANGRVVMRDRSMTTVDEPALQRELATLMPSYREEPGRAVKATEPLARAFEEQSRRVSAGDVGLDHFLYCKRN